VADGKFGQAVSGIAASPGDVDGDGLDDLIIGAPWVEVNGVSSAGIAYVYSVAEPPQTGPLLREVGNIYVSSETPNALGNSVSFNPLTKSYAVGYSDSENHQVKSRIVEADGSMPFQANIVSQTPPDYYNYYGGNPSSPALEYEYNDNGFIALWSEDGGGSVRRYDVMAADLGSNAEILGPKTWVTPRYDSKNQSRGFLSLNPNTGAYLATWREESQSRITGQIRDRIFGRFGSGAYDLTSSRPPIQISFPNYGNSDGGGLAAFDDASNTWLVVWTRRNYNLPYNDPGRDTTMGQRMATIGRVGSVISPLPSGISDIIANPSGPGWILVRSEGNEIVATFMNSDGTLGSEFQLTADSEIDSYPSIAALNGYYLVTWNRPMSGTRTIVAQLFDSTFFPLGGIIQVPSFADASQSQPGVAANPEDEEFLVVWYQGSYDSRKVYAQLLSISPNTPAGQDVTVNSGSGITVIFDEVTVPGTTTITTSTIPPAGNFGIEFIPLFYDITTTATFTGNVHIEINYDDSFITPPAQETDLRLFKFPGTPPAPIDITDGSISPNPDTTANMIYGVTDGFSIFAVGFLLNQPPVADAGDDDTVPADALCEADVSLDGGGSYDPDGTIEKYTWTGPFGGVLGVNPTVTLGLGENTITLTVSDGELTSTDEVVVTVEDTTPPAITSPADVTFECPAVISLTDTGEATATDNCSVTIASTDVSTPGCGDTETITRTWMATDGSNSSNAVQTITVVDNTAPVITAPADVTLECGSDTSTATTGLASAADTCGGTTLSYSDSFAAGCGNTEVITRTWAAEDACGNTATFDQIITLVDTTAPSLTIPADVTLGYPADTTPGSTGTATADDACGTVDISFEDASAAGCGNTEVLTRTWTAKDACGNTTTGVQTITVVDTTAPVLSGVPPDTTVGSDSVPPPQNVTVSDNSDLAIAIDFTEEKTPGGCADIYTLTRTWTATDACSNTAAATQVISVVDAAAPDITLPADVTLDCPADIDPLSTGQATALDTCGEVILTYDDQEVAGCGDTRTITRTWTAVDPSGNRTSADQIITVVDNTAPVITAPADVTLECASDTSTATTGLASVADTCGGTILSYSDSFTAGCGATGVITRTWTATDDCGNTATVDQIITLEDTSAPSLTTPADVTLEYPADTTPGNTGTATAADFCGTVTISFEDATVPGCGNTEVLTRTWTAVDACGNTTTGVQTINVVDTTAPVLSGVPTDTTVGSDSVPPPQNVTVSDNSGLAIAIDFKEEKTPGGCADIYTLTRTWAATDACSNTTAATQVIAVVDAAAPDITLPADVTLDCPADIDPLSTGQATALDTCGEVILTYDDQEVVGCGDTRTITRTWTATDESGNTNTGDQIITVADTTAPVLDGVPADMTVGSTETIPAPAEVQATDGCSGSVAIEFTETRTDSGCPDVYTLTRTWTATDLCGNSTTAAQVITVVDTAAPTISCPANVTVGTDPGANSAGTVTLGAPSVDDNCQVASVVSNAPTAYPLGTTAVDWTVTDASGNFATCTQLVTVVDTETPAITNPTGNTTGTTGDPVTINATLGDNVGLSSATLYYRPINAVGYTGLDFSAGSAVVPVANNAAGQILYYILARDSAGNEGRAPGTGTYAITVSDDEAPVALGDSYSAVEDTPLTVAAPGVLANDTDNISGVTLTAVLAGNAAHGAVVLNPDGSFTYTPAANFNGTDTFTYRANDGFADSAPATVTISVAAVNDAPVLGVIGDQTVDEGETLNLQVAATDPDGTTPALSATDLPANATFVDNGDGTGTFTWEIGFEDAGVYSISFTASDGTLSDTRTMTLTVNDLPSFRLVSPPSGVELPYKPPATFVWEGGDYKKFYVQFSRFSNFPRHRTLTLPVKRKKKQSVTSLTPRRGVWAIIRLMEKRGGIIYWRVKAREKKGFRDYTDDWSFSIEDPKWISHWKKRWGRYRDNWVDRDD